MCIYLEVWFPNLRIKVIWSISVSIIIFSEDKIWKRYMKTRPFPQTWTKLRKSKILYWRHCRCLAVAHFYSLKCVRFRLIQHQKNSSSFTEKKTSPGSQVKTKKIEDDMSTILLFTALSESLFPSHWTLKKVSIYQVCRFQLATS